MKIAMVVAIAGIVVILCMASIAMAETSESAGSQVPGNYVGSYTVPVDSSAIGATALDTGAIEKKIIEQVNAERTSRGLNALTKKSKLTRLARRWSSHMNRANSLHHPGHLPSGVYGQNIAYTYAGMNVNFPCSGGLHYIPNTADGVATAVMDMFMNHDACQGNGHRNNILRVGWTKIGVGVKYGHNKYWVTQDFA